MPKVAIQECACPLVSEVRLLTQASLVSLPCGATPKNFDIELFPAIMPATWVPCYFEIEHTTKCTLSHRITVEKKNVGCHNDKIKFYPDTIESTCSLVAIGLHKVIAILNFASRAIA